MIDSIEITVDGSTELYRNDLFFLVAILRDAEHTDNDGAHHETVSGFSRADPKRKARRYAYPWLQAPDYY